MALREYCAIRGSDRGCSVRSSTGFSGDAVVHRGLRMVHGNLKITVLHLSPHTSLILHPAPIMTHIGYKAPKRF